jgi:hypothetical protein
MTWRKWGHNSEGGGGIGDGNLPGEILIHLGIVIGAVVVVVPDPFVYPFYPS